MKITRNKKEENNPSYDLHNKKIQKVEEEKDIGVTIDSQLTFRKSYIWKDCKGRQYGIPNQTNIWLSKRGHICTSI